MTERSELKIGCFYWIIPVLDVDRGEEWEYYAQPARFRGLNANGEEVFDDLVSGVNPDMENPWPVRWIGDEIVPPEGWECPEHLIANVKVKREF